MIFRLSFLFVLMSAAGFAEERPRLGVFELATRGTTRLESELASLAVVKGIRELDTFNVVSTDDIRQLLAIERQRQLLGVENDSNVKNSLQVMGIRHTVVGSLNKTQEGYFAELRLLDSQTGNVVTQKNIGPLTPFEKIISQLPTVAQEVVNKLLADETGLLTVTCRDEGAEVYVDDALRGSTPMRTPIELSRGKHRLTLKKSGFVARTTTVTIQKGETTAEDVWLVPSQEFATLHRNKNLKLRAGAWIASGIAVAAFGGALLTDRAFAEPRYQSEFLPRSRVLTALSQQASTASFTSKTEAQCLADPTACRQKLQQVQSNISTLQIVTWVLVGVGAVSTGVAAYCWIAGEDPKKYAHIVASAGPNGGSIGIVGHF